ncbi:MAG: fructosamine kinase family protein [Opitutales bacterium]
MMHEELKNAVEAAIKEATGTDFHIKHSRAQGGGCINEASVVGDGSQDYFVKLNAGNAISMFETEAAALQELAETKTIRVPRPITHGLAAGRSYLILEALPFGSPQTDSWEAMGQQLARLHGTTADHFGWHRDNVIGSTPQQNAWTDSWAEFFREKRLRPQFDLAAQNGFTFAKSDDLLGHSEDLLGGHFPEPSLLHGDLWSGNASFLEGGTPVIFDPATYYGDREADLAFSEFFGGFPSSFYTAYHQECPLPPGYAKRKILYNLYHVLNHANLFGGGYAGQAERMIADLLTPTF